MSPEYAAEWVRKAEADRLAAKRALKDSRKHPDQTEIACYHAQQCAEKYLKSLLAGLGRSVPRTHDLPTLVQRIGNTSLSAAKRRKDFYFLNQFGVEIRYPGASATFKEARETVRAMERIVKRVRKLVP